MTNSTPFKVGHVHLKVRNLDRAEAFYTSILGLKVVERVGRYLFLSFGHEHHDIALNEVGEDAGWPRERDAGLFHVAVEVPSVADVKEVAGRLAEAGLPVEPVDHGISKSIYFDDPDGNGIEVYVDTRTQAGISLWRGDTRPLDLGGT
ncbi:MAG: VOC family protein [Limisphaerales bacterium]